MKTRIFTLSCFLFACSQISIAQLALETGYNPLLAVNYGTNGIEQTHRQIGNYKVKGSSYLFKNVFRITVFKGNATISSNNATYDTYFQKVEIIDSTGKTIEFRTEDVDSFKVVDYLDPDKGLINKTFLNPSLADPSKRIFLEKLVAGSKISFYKTYNSTLEDYSSGFAQTIGFKQFRTTEEYFYSTLTAPNNLIKIKFSDYELNRVLSGVSKIKFPPKDNLYDDPEYTLIIFVKSLNENN